MDQAIQNILEPKEKIIWKGKQELKSAILFGVATTVLLILIGLVFLFFSSGTSGSCKVNGEVRPIEDCNSSIRHIAYGLFIFAFISILFSYLRYRVTYYTITNKRVILKSGLIGADMHSIPHEQIEGAYVNVGLIGKMFGTGSVVVNTGRMIGVHHGAAAEHQGLSNIENPYEVYKYLQQIISKRKENLYSGKTNKKE